MRTPFRGVSGRALLAALALGNACAVLCAEAPWVVRPEHQLPPAAAGADGLERGPLVGPIVTTLKGVHPRLFFTAARLQEIKALVQGDPEWKAMYRILLREEADYALEQTLPDSGEDMAGDEGEELWQRKVGKRISNLALAYLLSGEDKYLAGAKKYMFKSISYKTWGLGKYESSDLAAAQQFQGLALGYDWLYAALTPEERARIREVLLPRARTMAQRAATGKVWWHSAWLQNHLCVDCAGLAAVAFALYDEEPDAAAWVRLAHGKFLKVLENVMDDGASHEGYTYWTYGLIHLLEYTELSRTLLGINLYQSGGVDHPWLKNAPAFALYSSAPRSYFKSPERRHLLPFGDSGFTQNHGPANILRVLAARYPAAPLAGAGAWLAKELQDAGADATWEAFFLNMSAFDPRVKPAPPDALPTLRHFNDLDLVVARSGWSGTESVLAVKCGPPEGHKNVNATIPNSGGHAHPDAGHFLFAAHGAFLVLDEGTTSKKQTGFNNTLLVDGRGQKGESQRGEYDMQAWYQDRRAPRILSAASTPVEDVIVCDVAPAYPPDVGMAEFRRTFRFAKPDVVLVSDRVATQKPAELEWRFHLDGQATKVSETVFCVTQKEAALDIAVLAPAGVRASLGPASGAKGRARLSLMPPAKTAEAQLIVVLRARDARDATPFAPVLENGHVRLAAGGRSLALSIHAASSAPMGITAATEVPSTSSSAPLAAARVQAPVATKQKAPEPSAEEKALAARRYAEFRAAIETGVAAGRKPQVKVEILGRETPAQLVQTAADELVVSPGGAEFKIKWADLTPKRFYGIACHFVSDHQALYEFCAGSGLEAEAEREAFLR